MKLNELTSKLKTKTLQFSEKVANNPVVKFIKRKENQLVLRIDALPKPLMLALHVTPLINIPALYLKEQGLKARLPEYETHINAELRFAPLNEQVNGLMKQKEAYSTSIKSMTDTRAALASQPQPKSLKERASRRIASWQCSESKIRDANKAQEKVQKRLDQLSPKRSRAYIDKMIAKQNLDAVNTRGESAAIDKERKHLKYAFRVGLGILTAATVAVIALSAFAIIPAVVGFGFGIALGASLGLHIALPKSNSWKHNGDMILTTTD